MINITNLKNIAAFSMLSVLIITMSIAPAGYTIHMIT